MTLKERDGQDFAPLSEIWLRRALGAHCKIRLLALIMKRCLNK
jgi:hypothetical protein